MEVKKVKELKAKMERDIANILKNFETETSLHPGIVFHERDVLAVSGDVEYKVNIPVHL